MHHWQDIVLSIGSLVFTAALVPSIVGRHKPALTSSVLTASVLVVFTLVYATLGLWFTTFSTALNCIAWLVLAIQKARGARSAGGG